MPLTIALIGCGKMGGALLRGWLAAGADHKIEIVEPHGLPDEFKTAKLNWYETPDRLAGPPDIAVMAVKPQMMEDVCQALKGKIRPDTLILSIAAGQTIAAFHRRFGAAQPVIRTMPNTPAAIGQGMTVAVASPQVSEERKRQTQDLLQSTGLLEWVDDESLLDPVTAVSGSGPAYVFLLIETMAAAGVNVGLPAPLAMKLARQTVIGSAALAAENASTDAAALRKNVTSPGGTTEAALNVLMNADGLESLMAKAVSAATSRSRELSDK